MKTFKNVSYGQGRYRTQKAVAHFPSIATPDFKFDKDGRYVATVNVSAERAAQMKKEVAEEVKEGVKELHKGSRTKPTLNSTPFKEQEDGNVRVTIAMKAKTYKGEDVRPPIVVDNKGRPLSGEAAVFGNGSIVDVGYRVKVWKAPSGGYGYSFTPQVVVLYEKQLMPVGNMIGGYGFDFAELDEDDEEAGGSLSFDDDDKDGDKPGHEDADEEEAPDWDDAEEF